MYTCMKSTALREHIFTKLTMPNSMRCRCLHRIWAKSDKECGNYFPHFEFIYAPE